MLDRAAEIRAAQSDRYRRLARARGIPEERIHELGGHELLYHLGDVHMLLGEPAKAVDDFARLRRLAPLSAQTHFAVARAAMATNDPARAVRAITIAVALGRRDAPTQALLLDAYRRLDPRGCAVAGTGDRAELDYTCPLVREHRCVSYVELVELGIEAGQWALARRVGDAAVRTARCDAARFEALLARAGAECGARGAA